MIVSRYKLTERMFFACQALKMHLSDDNTLSGRELVGSVPSVRPGGLCSGQMCDPGYMCTFTSMSIKWCGGKWRQGVFKSAI